MRHVIFAVLLVGSLAVPALAQQHRAMMPEMSSAQMQQLRQMHMQVRSQILGYLTPAHKTLLAQIAGQLAISPNPDYDGAASRLDAALSPSEKQNVMNAANAAMAKMRAMMAAHSGSMMPQHMEHMTAGGIVLMVAVGHGMEMMR